MKLTMSPLRPYRLADHVRACAHDGQVILLDLRRDKYLAIGGPALPALSGAIDDWPTPEDDAQSQSGGDKLGNWLRKLTAAQMLATAQSPRLPRATLQDPIASLDAQSHAAGPHGWRRPLHIARSAAMVALWLKRLSLAEIERRVRRMHEPGRSSEHPAFVAQLHDAVASYCRLRPFLFTVHDRCLFDSLTLVCFLAMEGLPTRWVIGVRTRPFAAHSWVQSGHLVLNDVQEHVRRYTPILVV